MTDKNTADKHAIDNNVAQGIAAYIDYLNQLRVSTLMDTLRQFLIMKQVSWKISPSDKLMR